METKITLIIDNPAAPEVFEREMPAIIDRAEVLPGLLRLESAKVWPKEDGTETPAYRTLDLYFEDYGSALHAVGTAAAAAFFEIQQLGESNSYAPESAAITVDEGQLAWQTTASDYGPFR